MMGSDRSQYSSQHLFSFFVFKKLFCFFAYETYVDNLVVVSNKNCERKASLKVDAQFSPEKVTTKVFFKKY